MCSYVFAPVPGIQEGFSTNSAAIKSPAQVVLSLVAQEGGVRLGGRRGTTHIYAHHGTCQHALKERQKKQPLNALSLLKPSHQPVGRGQAKEEEDNQGGLTRRILMGSGV